MSPEPLRLGIAGCGRIAERGYLPALGGLPEVRLAAVADPDPARAAGLLAGLDGASRFEAVGPMLAAGEVDALLVATPATDHVASASLAAEAGVPCLIEKPPATDLAGALRLARLDPLPAIGFNRRFLQGRALAASIPADGWLEMELELRFRQRDWDAHACRDEALLDAGTHLIDLAGHLAGSAPIAVRAVVLERERVELWLELGRARARLRCATDRRYAELVEVRDRGGRPVASSSLGGMRSRLATLRGGTPPLALSLRRQLLALAAQIRDGEAGRLASAHDGVVAMAVVEAARESARLGGAEVTVTGVGLDDAEPVGDPA
ncbi:MAG TPA: Gfo/Idh/MocA family oxidoreductase [Solirubrobacterales bacterium]|nr:Gfo/Idh/MocA family oxidoreductase [Solirubrobacterales bacterium]